MVLNVRYCKKYAKYRVYKGFPVLIEFSVSNFRSIGETIKFSTVAGTSSAKRDDISSYTGNSFAERSLKSAVIFGPNASGKSSIIEALAFFQNCVASSFRKDPNKKFGIPFNKFHSKYLNGSFECEMIFVHEKQLYQYGFVLNDYTVEEEWLFLKKSKNRSQIRCVFQRAKKSKKAKTYDWYLNENILAGEKELWKKSTRPDALFLSSAAQLNSKELKHPFDWITSHLHVLMSYDRLEPNFTAKLLQEKGSKTKIKSILHSLDLKIEDFHVVEKKFELPKEASALINPELLEKIAERGKSVKSLKIFTMHRNFNDELVEFEFEEESEGTKAIIGLVGPLLDVLENGYTLIVDELNNSLHPLALRAIVSIFNDPVLNKKGAQLIFTSHETSILAKDFMHKDQVWFVERPRDLWSTLTPLSDYNVRALEAFQRAYLGGKFGALPNIKSVENGRKAG